MRTNRSPITTPPPSLLSPSHFRSLNPACSGQCLERAHGDFDLLQDVCDKVLESDLAAAVELHHNEVLPGHTRQPTLSAVCLVCQESLLHPTIFDCDHPVCFACATGILQANYKDSIVAMRCPCRVEGCTGELALDKIPEMRKMLNHQNAERLKRQNLRTCRSPTG